MACIIFQAEIHLILCRDFLGRLEERDNLKNLSVGGKIILNRT
jgi:hypothetical protein